MIIDACIALRVVGALKSHPSRETVPFKSRGGEVVAV